MTRIAVDLLGEGLPAGTLLEALPAALDADPKLVLILVAVADEVRDELSRLGIAIGERVLLRSASQSVVGGPGAVRDVRGRRDAGVRVAARLVRDGDADAMVSVAPVESVVAAAHFTCGLVPGATRATLATGVGVPGGTVILCDAGASPAATADELVQCALLGSAYASLRFAVPQPRLGLLTARPALVDPQRRTADDVLAGLDVQYEGPWAAQQLFGPRRVDEPPMEGSSASRRDSRPPAVLVTDGYTGDVLLSALRELAGGWGRRVAVGTDDGPDPAWGTLEDPDVRGETIVLGVDGVLVHADHTRGGSVDADGSGLLTALRVASLAVQSDLVSRSRAAMAGLVAWRRDRVGLVG